jgi:hypothetical protein
VPSRRSGIADGNVFVRNSVLVIAPLALAVTLTLYTRAGSRPLISNTPVKFAAGRSSSTSSGIALARERRGCRCAALRGTSSRCHVNAGTCAARTPIHRRRQLLGAARGARVIFIATGAYTSGAFTSGHDWGRLETHKSRKAAARRGALIQRWHDGLASKCKQNNFWQMILGRLAAKELLGARRLYGRDAGMR